MKWLSLLLFSLAFLLGCASPDKANAPHDKLVVLSTIVMIGDAVSFIGADHVVSEVLIGRELDPHSYEFVKGDDEKLMEADVIFYSGLGLEHGGRRYLESSDKAHSLGDKVAAKHPEALIHIDGVIDPHIWMDASLWKMIIPHIVEILSQNDEAHRDFFASRGRDLMQKYEQLHHLIRCQMQQIPPERCYLVTSHDAFNYFAKAYFPSCWQSRVFAPEGLAPDGQMSFHELRLIVDAVKTHAIAVLFPEAYANLDPLKKIEECASLEGSHVRLADKPLYSDSMPPGESYERMMSYNAGVIYEQLAG